MPVSDRQSRLMRILADCDAIYRVHKDEQGNRLSPLVGYAGKYDGPDGKLQYVGEVYYDFAMVEQQSYAISNFAAAITEQADKRGIDLVLGMPMGGITLSFCVADMLGCSFAFAEKKVISLATVDAREQSKLVIARHKIPTGSKVAIGEDVCNNLSTAEEATALVESLDAEVTTIVCAINRSQTIDEHPVRMFYGIPVISAMEIPTAQYCQDDPYVAEDVTTGNVVWKPKEEWGLLMKVASGQDT